MNSADFQLHLERMIALKGDMEAFCEHVTLHEPLSAIQFMVRLNTLSPFWNAEENKPASNSVLRRWIEQSAILFNGERMKFDELIDFPLFSLVLFPKSSAKRITVM